MSGYRGILNMHSRGSFARWIPERAPRIFIVIGGFYCEISVRGWLCSYNACVCVESRWLLPLYAARAITISKGEVNLNGRFILSSILRKWSESIVLSSIVTIRQQISRKYDKIAVKLFLDQKTRERERNERRNIRDTLKLHPQSIRKQYVFFLYTSFLFLYFQYRDSAQWYNKLLFYFFVKLLLFHFWNFCN